MTSKLWWRIGSVALRVPTTTTAIAPRLFLSADKGVHTTRFHRPGAHPSKHQDDPKLLIRVPPTYELFDGHVHCILGRNASGKSTLLRKIARAASERSGSSRCIVRTLSLDAHAKFVHQFGGKLVANVLGGIGSAKARDLIVRLGLFPVWDSRVKHLSTGELRKLMLASALLARPKAQVLILDQPFDGLDAKARDQLVYLLKQLTKGFTRLLVDTGGHNRAQAYKTQVVYVANRLDQVVGDILTHVVLLAQANAKRNGTQQHQIEAQDHGNEQRDAKHFGMQIWPWMAHHSEHMMAQLKHFLRQEAQQVDVMTETTMINLVNELFSCSLHEITPNFALPAIELCEFSIGYGDRRILDSTTMTRQWHQHWALLGPNGCGKSSFSRVLLNQMQCAQLGGSLQVFGKEFAYQDDEANDPQLRVDAVSTNSHLEMIQLATEKKLTTEEVFAHENHQPNAVHLAFRLVGLVGSEACQDETVGLLTRPFTCLSQGEQRLVLIARALANKPHVLVLDELTHGLDQVNRQHVLRVVNCLGFQSQQDQLGGTGGTGHRHRLHLIMITHYEEEIPTCFVDRCHLTNRQFVWDTHHGPTQQS